MPAETPRLSPRKQKQSQAAAERFFDSRTSATPAASGSTAVFSSSPAFATPLHPLRPYHGSGAGALAGVGGAKAAILPIQLPAATLRPLAFRVFTKKHSLTLTASALQELAAFIGRHCGSGWREEGLAERVLEETAKSWKNRNCGFIVDGASVELKEILKTLEGNMSGGRVVLGGAKGGHGTTGAAAGAAKAGVPGAGAATAHVSLARQSSLLLDGAPESEIVQTRMGLRPAPAAAGAAASSAVARPALLVREDSQSSFGMGSREEEDKEAGDDALMDPRTWLRVVGAFDQPRMYYNVQKKHFERDTSKPSLLANVAHKTAVFRNRYHVIHQRLLRSELFQSSAVAEARAGSPSAASSLASRGGRHKITPVANLLGRHGTHHMLLGMLVVLPTGGLAICDLSASIALDLSQAVAVPDDSAWFTPGMMVLVDGVYEEEEESVGRGLNGASGVGGNIGGRFQAFFLGQPPSEKRRATLGISGPDGGPDHTIGGGFGWIDFLGVGSQRAVGGRMRKLEQRFLSRQKQQQQEERRRRRQQQHLVAASAEEGEDVAAEPAGDEDADSGPDQGQPPSAGRLRVVVLGEVNLDQPRALQALRKILGLYAAEPEGSTPVAFVLAGHFVEHAVMARGGSGGSIEYKEYFDALASTLADFPTLLQASTFVFVPGDNEGWASAFGGGAAVPLPRKPVPDMFTSRVRRAFATANNEAGLTTGGGAAVWTSNPSRLTLFGPNHELVIFRDDISSRLRRTAVRLASRGGEGGERGGGRAAGEGEDQMEVDGPPADAGSGPPPAIPHDVRAARKLVKTLLDQGYLAPFRQAIRPVHWDFASALHLYPLPTAMVLVDTSAPPFCLTYEGCHVMNPGSLLVAGRRSAARWIEYGIGRTGRLRECIF